MVFNSHDLTKSKIVLSLSVPFFLLGNSRACIRTMSYKSAEEGRDEKKYPKPKE